MDPSRGSRSPPRPISVLNGNDISEIERVEDTSTVEKHSIITQEENKRAKKSCVVKRKAGPFKLATEARSVQRNASKGAMNPYSERISIPKKDAKTTIPT